MKNESRPRISRGTTTRRGNVYDQIAEARRRRESALSDRPPQALAPEAFENTAESSDQPIEKKVRAPRGPRIIGVATVLTAALLGAAVAMPERLGTTQFSELAKGLVPASATLDFAPLALPKGPDGANRFGIRWPEKVNN